MVLLQITKNERLCPNGWNYGKNLLEQAIYFDISIYFHQLCMQRQNLKSNTGAWDFLTGSHRK
jgi:hypothetical protein